MQNQPTKDFMAGMIFMTDILLAAEKHWTQDDYFRGLQLIANGMNPRGEHLISTDRAERMKLAKEILKNP